MAHRKKVESSASMTTSGANKVVPGDNESTKSTPERGMRIDGVFLLAIVGVIAAIIALALEIYVLLLDQDWNKFLDGKRGLKDNYNKYFDKKTLMLKGSENSDKARKGAMRSEPLEPAFIAIVALCIIIVLCHLCGCYIRRKASTFTIMVAVYIGCGIGCLVACILLIIAANNIHENYGSAADNLVNVQEDLKGLIKTKNCTHMMERAARDECGSLAFSKVQAGQLESIFRECKKAVGFSRPNGKVQLVDEDFVYTRGELEEIGFCQKDHIKYWAAILAAIAALLFFLVPFIYCLLARRKKEAEVVPEAEVKAPAQEERKHKRGSRSETYYLDQFRQAIMQETYSETETEPEKPQEKCQPPPPPKPACPPPKPACPPPKPACPPPKPACPPPPPPRTPECVKEHRTFVERGPETDGQTMGCPRAQAPQQKCRVYREQLTTTDGDYSYPASTQPPPPPQRSCPPPQQRTCPRCGSIPCRC